jgi:hypothetical protein
LGKTSQLSIAQQRCGEKVNYANPCPFFFKEVRLPSANVRGKTVNILVLPERNSSPFQLGLFPYYCVKKASPGSPGSTFLPYPTKKFLR